MKSINIYYGDSGQDELVAHSYNIDKLDITLENGSYIEFIEHFPSGNPNHDMRKEAEYIVCLYPEDNMCIKNGVPVFYDDHKYYEIPKACYKIYRGKEQKPKMLHQLSKED
ncbi:hypothetical protein [Mammaliicoccus fleurettii]|uniref:hypothetical protein n=1 Tax=Mammaliicoccus fleurettii TaxID=150056 RepID=UPI000993DF58|nr:hypothetical protein [Mammaliicoccus fleurettii]OOV78887.1 hypothetical protein B2G86_00755 [Mammaliicoccus fleurettii]